MSNINSAVISTLGVAPQVVTISLDLLLKQGEEVSALHVLCTHNKETQQAFRKIEQEFQRGKYPGIILHEQLLSSENHQFRDMDHEPAMLQLMQQLFTLVTEAHKADRRVHLCIAGGRKVMAIAAMVVAQLVFRECDCIWHLFSDMYDLDDQCLHAGAQQNSRLVRVPVLRYGYAAQMLAAFTNIGDVRTAMALQEQFIEADSMKRRREFLRRWLTKAEFIVAELACSGLDNKSISARLFKSERTVSNQLQSIYEKLDEWRDAAATGNSDRNFLIATFAPYFYFKKNAK